MYDIHVSILESISFALKSNPSFNGLNNKEIISRMYNQREIKIGQKIEFSINLNKIHIFDKDTEKVIK